MKPKIALVVTDQETNAQIKSLKVDLIEIRVDLFKKLDLNHIRQQISTLRLLKKPLLLTVRNQKREGAVKDWSDDKKREILQVALPLVDMVDIELSSPLLKEILSLAGQLKKKTIISIHDFQQTPVHLENILKKALSTRSDIIKIAAKANSFDDVFRMVEFTRQHHKHPLITLSMGPFGKISRLILPAAGSLYTYTFINKAAAPGQIDLKTLQGHLKFYYP
ncbi:MAG: type I 3-dehydroquinate dehydratase [Candidatus Omnitrophota bacterium]